MKNKKNIYFLTPAVLLIWGLIGYRVFFSINPSNKNDNKVVQTKKFKPNQKNKKNHFVLIANYRDPFLGTMSKPKSKSKIFRKGKIEQVIFPKIEYKGIFSSSQKKNTIYLIIIDGKKEMFKINEIYQKVKLIRGNKESIIVKFKSKKQSFYLK